MRGFRRNNALYTISHSFMFIFLLTPFDTKNCYDFESNLCVVLLMKVFLTKILGQYCQKTVVKSVCVCVCVCACVRARAHAHVGRGVGKKR